MMTHVPAASAALLSCAIAASAAPLTGNGSNLGIPSPNPGAPASEAFTLATVTGGFTGTWSAPALPDWQGTFSATGPVPSGLGNPTGTTLYDFTTLPTGLLPSGTFFFFGDVDGGSATNETFVFSAFDAAGNLVTNAWLNEPVGVTGTGTGAGGAILPNNMPGWDWDAGTGTYTITGADVTGGNPTLGVYLTSNTAIATMRLTRTSGFANFTLRAPVPAPGTATLVGLAGLAAARRRRSS